MKTFLEIVLLLFLIGLGALIYSLHVAEPNNLLNKELRPILQKSHVARKVFSLNKPGDYRYAYVSSKTPEIMVELDMLAGIEPNQFVERWIEQMIAESVKKYGSVALVQEITDGYKESYTYEELEELDRKHRSQEFAKQPGYLHVLYLTRSADEPTNAGMVLNDQAIFVFIDVIKELSEREDIRARVEQSTLMHEWGHLLGLNHTEAENCVMSEKVEVYGNQQFQFNNIPLTHCRESMAELDNLLHTAE
jgi:hypothetical protein